MAIVERTDTDFEQSIKSGLHIVDLYGEGCIPCKMLASVIQSVEAEMPFVDFIKVNTTQNSKVAESYKVDAVPKLLVIKDGAVLDTHLGYMDEAALSDWIGQYLYC